MNLTTVDKKIAKLKEAALLLNLPMVEMPTLSFLLEGMYLRQIRIPSGTAFVGRKHKKFHYFMCLAGGAWLTGAEGLINMHAGMVLSCEPGTQRIGITYADTIFVGVFRTDSNNLEEIENELTVKDPTCRYGLGNEILPTGL